MAGHTPQGQTGAHGADRMGDSAGNVRAQHMRAWLDDTDAIACDLFQSPALRVDIKDDKSPVTQADRSIEQYFRDAIARHFPHDAVLGEEQGGGGTTSEWVWTIDPIDGTLAFTTGVPLFGTLIAVARAGELVAGACSLPALGERVWARAGGGAWWSRSGRPDPQPARVRPSPVLADALICTSGSEFYRRSGRFDVWERLAREVGTLRGWSDCYGGVLLATGRCDGWLDPVMAPWDIGPFPLILREAGAVCTDWGGRAQETPPLASVCAAGPDLHPDLLRLLAPSCG